MSAQQENPNYAHTFLGDELYLGNQANVSGGRHWMIEKNSAVLNGALVSQDDGATCTQAHSCQALIT